MAQTPQTLLIPFKGGLNTFSNPQLLSEGNLTAATGVMLDRPGAAYAGPGFTPAQFAPSASARTNHGIAAVAGGSTTNTDQLLVWDTITGGTGPAIHVPGDASTESARFPLAPWRQSTQRFQSDNTTQASGAFTAMAAPPSSCRVGNRAFYVWATATQLCMCYQDLNTKLWAGPFIFDGNTATWVSDPATIVAGGVPAQFAIAGDSTYFRLGIRQGTVATGYAWLGSTSTGTAAAAGGFSRTNCSNIAAMDTGDEYAYGGVCPGAFLVHNTATTSIDVINFSGSAAAYSVSTNSLAAAAASPPYSGNPIKSTSAASTSFMVVVYAASASLKIYELTYAGGGIMNLTSTTTWTGLVNADTGIAITAANIQSGTMATVGVAVEFKPAAGIVIAGQTVTWNYVQFTTLTKASPAGALTITTKQGWGGLAVLSKMHSWYSGVEARPLVACRTGWRHYNGTWGTASTAGVAPAYPNGYLYDYTGQAYGKFGDGDVGTDALWPQFSAAGYSQTALNPLSAMFSFSLTSGQQTLTCPWPQYGDFLFASARATGDAGAIIGARAGLATVTWLAPTSTEPPAPSVQFGTTLVIPGTLTAYYDGSSVFEAGFLHACPQPFIVSNAGGGSLPNTTTYQFVGVMVYKDASGRYHYSTPSKPVYAVTTAANDSFTIKFPYVDQTLRNGSTPVAFWVYRNAPSTATPAAYYRLPTSTLVNVLPISPASPFTVGLSDGSADATISTGLRLYTDGQNPAANLGTFAPPPFDSVTVWNNQVWGLANRNGPELWATWQQSTAVLRPEGPAWSPANRVGLPAELGTPKGLVGLDEKLLTFGTKCDIGFIGQAPARYDSFADNPSLFSSAVTLPSPGGMRVLNGLTRLPDGILIQGTQGFLMLDRSMTYKLVGVQIKDFSTSNLYLPGIFLPEQEAVLLFSASDATKNLVLFYGTGEWSQIEQPPADGTNTAAATVLVGAARAVAGQTSSVYVLPMTGVYYEQVSAYSKYLSFRTPWISLDSHAVGARTNIATSAFLREIQVQGILPAGFPGAQTLTLYTEYDYVGNTLTPPETQSLTLTTGAQADLDYQWRFGARTGNCRRVRFTVTIDGGVRSAATGTLPGVLLTGLMLSYSVDTGLSRLGAANSAGT